MTPKQFNKTHILGQAIQYKDESGQIKQATIRHQAELTETGKPIVWVSGRYNAVPLKNVVK